MVYWCTLTQAAIMPLGSAHVSKTPAGHGISLGKAAQCNGSLLHAGKGGNADMFCIVIDKLAVDLVCHHQKVILDGKLAELFQCLSGENASCRVAGVDDDDHLCPCL